MLEKWKGKLTQDSGNVINASYHFKLVSNGNTIREELIEDGVEMFTTILIRTESCDKTLLCSGY